MPEENLRTVLAGVTADVSDGYASLLDTSVWYRNELVRHGFPESAANIMAAQRHGLIVAHLMYIIEEAGKPSAGIKGWLAKVWEENRP